MADSDPASLSEPERVFLRTLDELGVRYLLVGMSAALLQGARGATEDLDLWFEDLSDPRIGEAAKRAEPPPLDGMSERFDVVLTMSGLPRFADEYSRAVEHEVDGVRVRVLPLDRIIASKRAANRTKDTAVLHALESAQKIIDVLKQK